MPIQNQRGRTSFDRSPPRYVEGQIAEGPKPIGRPMPYPTRRAIWTITFDGTPGDGTYTSTVSSDGYDDLEVSLVVDGGELLDQAGDPYDPSVPVTDAGELGDAWILRLLELPKALEVVDTATNDAGEVTVVFRTAGRTSSISVDAVPAQAIVFTVLGDPAGSTTITINGEDHVEDPTGLTDTQVRDAFVTAINAGAEAGAVTASPIDDAEDDKLLVVSDTAGVAFTYAVDVATAEALVEIDVTVAEVQAPTGQPIRVGRFLVQTEVDGVASVRLPEATDTAASIAGVVGRSHTFPPRVENAQPDDDAHYVAGDMLDLLERVTLAMRNVGSVAADTNGQVYVVIDDAGGPDFGTARADADGDNAVAPENISVRWLEPTPAGELGLVRVRR